MDEEVLFYMPLSHQFWSLWGFIQHKYSEIDYDYLSFAKKDMMVQNYNQL